MVFITVTDDMDMRRRRAAWRAGHRGTKELDLLIGGFARAKLADMGADELARFERFLDVDDNLLQSWLLTPTAQFDATEAEEHKLFVSQVRQFHGLS